MTRKITLRFCTAAYACAFLFWLALGGIRAAQLSQTQPVTLSVQEAVLSSVRDDYPVDWGCWQTGDLLTTDGDAFLLWQPTQPVSGLAVQLVSSQPIQDLRLYYTLPGEPDFTHSVQPYRVSEATGQYFFRLPGAVTVERLRLDPTSAAGAFFRLESITLNPSYPVWQCWLPSLPQAVGLAVLPLLAGLAAQRIFCLFPINSPKKEP